MVEFPFYWNEIFSLAFPTPSTKDDPKWILQLIVKAKKTLKAKIGECKIDLREMLDGQVHDCYFNIQRLHQKKKNTRMVMANIHLRLQMTGPVLLERMRHQLSPFKLRWFSRMTFSLPQNYTPVTECEDSPPEDFETCAKSIDVDLELHHHPCSKGSKTGHLE